MARVREMGPLNNGFMSVCREVVLHLARVREMVYEQWLHVVCREVVLQWLESERWCMNNGCMLCVGRWCSTWLE